MDGVRGEEERGENTYIFYKRTMEKGKKNKRKKCMRRGKETDGSVQEQCTGRVNSLVLLGAQASVRVDDVDVEHLRALDNILALRSGDVVRNLSTVGAVVHHQEVQVVNVVHNKLVESVREHVPCPLIRAVADARHGPSPLEPPPHPAVDASRETP